MRERCCNPGHKNYALYRGKLCEAWKDSRVFIEWAYEHGYWEGSTIDRIDPDGMYEPGNVQFLSHSENTAKGNKERRLTSFSLNGTDYTLTELSELAGVSVHCMYRRLKVYLWSIEEAVYGKQHK